MIRLATAGDVPAIRDLMHQVEGFWNDRWPEDVLEQVVSLPATCVLVYVSGDSVLGFASAHNAVFRAYLSELVVSPSAHGQGIGRALLGEVERRASEWGCPVIIVDAWRDAESFYRRCGWCPPPVVLLAKQINRGPV